MNVTEIIIKGYGLRKDTQLVQPCDELLKRLKDQFPEIEFEEGISFDINNHNNEERFSFGVKPKPKQ